MSGMAGNVSAFSTVWTYDIYGAYINKRPPTALRVDGPRSTVVGMVISVGTAYLVGHFATIMDYVQALFSFFIAPLFGTVVLGMLWKRATKGRLLGLLAGTVASIGMFIYTSTGSDAHKALALSRIALSPDAQPMAENMFRALWSWLICVAVIHCRQLSDQTENRCRTQWPGLWRDGDPARRLRRPLAKAHLLGVHRCSRLRRAADHLLLGQETRGNYYG